MSEKKHVIHDPEGIVNVIGQVIGFNPTDSVVVICTNGERRRFGATMRLDAALDDADEIGRSIAFNLGRLPHDNIIVATFTESADLSEQITDAVMPWLKDEDPIVVIAEVNRPGPSALELELSAEKNIPLPGINRGAIEKSWEPAEDVPDWAVEIALNPGAVMPMHQVPITLDYGLMPNVFASLMRDLVPVIADLSRQHSALDGAEYLKRLAVTTGNPSVYSAAAMAWLIQGNGVEAACAVSQAEKQGAGSTLAPLLKELLTAGVSPDQARSIFAKVSA